MNDISEKLTEAMSADEEYSTEEQSRTNSYTELAETYNEMIRDTGEMFRLMMDPMNLTGEFDPLENEDDDSEDYNVDGILTGGNAEK